MISLFRRKSKNREVQKVASMFAILDTFARRGLIYWKAKDKMLLIEESLATIKLAEGIFGFQRFLDQVAAWQNYRLISEAYEARRIDIEAKAVREAQKKANVKLADADIDRIRQNARSNMQEIDPGKLAIVHEFDILVIRATAPSREEATAEAGQLLAVGHYDGRRVEIAMYDDIKDTLVGGKEEEEK